MSDLLGKTAVVTGAAQGIGARLAKGLASAGANVAIADVLDGTEVVQEITGAGGNAIARKTDITDDASILSLIAAANAAFGPVDILVNNAALFGTLPPQPLEEISNETWDRVMAVNVRGVWQCAKAVIPDMEKQGGGVIVNIATNRIFKGFPELVHYDASKGAVLSMTKAMAAELGDRNIRVNAVCPGLTMSENVQAKDGIQDRNKVIVGGRALGRSQEPEDLIGAVLFFAGNDSAFVSGQSLIVDGGGIMI
ncbi:MAG: glucose 1-dehydrogenase [Pseudomonadota bacterium]